MTPYTRARVYLRRKDIRMDFLKSPGVKRQENCKLCLFRCSFFFFLFQLIELSQILREILGIMSAYFSRYDFIFLFFEP